MHADTFRILAATQNPDQAFTVLTHLLTDAALPLLTAYGAAPADPALTDAFLASLEERYPQGVNWQVALDSAAFADAPSHEQFLPGWEPYKEAMDTVKSGILTDPALDLDVAIADLEEQLTTIFQENAS
jgi:multiple sugar transport system substrate-binding protein